MTRSFWFGPDGAWSVRSTRPTSLRSPALPEPDMPPYGAYVSSPFLRLKTIQLEEVDS